ncbi:hypothetical protein Poli38472_000776 [Pythium oligandrum]|uniref:Ribosomal protein eL8/eL30/eS12/Gadd45 domain-containing protein n=1 Tax=Pythium oligandrum TaxID=41045 RepID=A0A8K1FH73_PYTOL|nr:hypothetical protein Poli38472_000776 [Pythium oligandrum]|eukprot:TMW60734.1 hypothetical protein Poli38472_000776 [Pythium oligandrum]
MGRNNRKDRPAAVASSGNTNTGKKAKPLAQQLKPTKPGEKSKRVSSEVTTRPWTVSQYEELSKEERDIVLDRVKKEIVEASVSYPVVQKYIVRGVNHVARLIAKRELRVVVFANNPDTGLFGHIPLLCRLHKVPICVLHLSSKAFGNVFQLPSLAVFGIKRLPKLPVPEEDTAEVTASEAIAKTSDSELSELEREKITSITEFFVHKASKKNHSL